MSPDLAPGGTTHPKLYTIQVFRTEILEDQWLIFRAIFESFDLNLDFLMCVCVFAWWGAGVGEGGSPYGI